MAEESGALGWVDASAGASGDMLLGALVGAGVPLAVMADAAAAVAPEAVRLHEESVLRAGLAATRVHVEVADTTEHRAWRDVHQMLEAAPIADAVRARALAAFERLAVAEGAVHGIEPAQVHFHEVGALDAIADVVGVSAGLEHLGLDRLVVSPVAVGSGRVEAAHGSMPVPVPAVAELLRGVPSLAGPATTEACTPTGAALLVAAADAWGAQPPMSVAAVGVGAGGRDPDSHANVVRLLVGRAVGGAVPVPGEGLWLLETNLDDLDPRLLPGVLDRLLALGAVDAWLTPIVMKKGRPAHVLAALVPAPLVDAAHDLVFAETTTLGVRRTRVDRAVCEREVRPVRVGGVEIAVKVATWRDRVVNAQPEFDDVAAAAAVLGRPVVEVLAEAAAAARVLTPGA
ncbi:nickel pincer cofactor biosynthesis protein LarC [Nocardioides nanhaiensis]|uniref:Pyridinium-3,5-bisthiocarboxylic acid mononucleotide nickel insertion protein n=1 Tax=Nocardioides nanhaiensis TaxID=1476871 RepID=A0ABP8WE12_9ACTN